MASSRGILNIQSLNELTSENVETQSRLPPRARRNSAAVRRSRSRYAPAVPCRLHMNRIIAGLRRTRGAWYEPFSIRSLGTVR
jgi:hypothetical protein